MEKQVRMMPLCLNIESGGFVILCSVDSTPLIHLIKIILIIIHKKLSHHAGGVPSLNLMRPRLSVSVFVAVHWTSRPQGPVPEKDESETSVD